MKKYLAAVTIMGFLFLTVGAYAQQPPAPQEKQVKPAPDAKAPLARLREFLKLTPEQEAKLKGFQKARQDEQKAFREQMQKLRTELNPLLKDPKADQNKINGLIDQITKLSADRMKKAIANRNPLEKILTPEQLEKLKNAPGRMMGPGLMMRGRGMGPMGPGRFMRPGMRPGLGFMGPQRFRGHGMKNFPLVRGLMRRIFQRHGFRR